MGKNSNTMNYYFSDSKRFADLFNAVFFQGKPVVDADGLSEVSEVYHQPKTEKPTSETRSKRVERIRDVCKMMKTGEVLRILAVENQELVDYAMPFRCMQYDVMEYGKQLEELRRKNEREECLETIQEKLCGLRREDRIVPVYTLCLYHGEEKWDGPRSLGEMMSFAAEDDFRALFNDYPLRLYCVNEAEGLELFHTEVAQLFHALKYRGNRVGLRQLLESDPEYRHLDRDTLEAMIVLLKLPLDREEQKRIMKKSEEKEEYDMCQAVREWAEEERQIGREESRMAIVRNLLRRGGIADEDIMQVAECDGEYLKRARATL